MCRGAEAPRGFRTNLRMRKAISNGRGTGDRIEHNPSVSGDSGYWIDGAPGSRCSNRTGNLGVHGLFAARPLRCISIRQAAPRMPRPVDPLREMAEGAAGGSPDAHRTGLLRRSEEASRSSISRSPCYMELQVVGSCRTLSVRSPIESIGRKASMRPHSNRCTSDARAGQLLSRGAQGVDPLLPLQQRARLRGSTLVLERDTWGTKCLAFAVNPLNTPRRKRAHTG